MADKAMTSDEAYEVGFANGAAAGMYCEVSAEHRRHACCECGQNDECAECRTAAAYDGEMGARDFSPFEFTAHAINLNEYPDDVWEAYDNGVTAGIESEASASA